MPRRSLSPLVVGACALATASTVLVANGGVSHGPRGEDASRSRALAPRAAHARALAQDPRPTPTLHDLESVEALRERFAADDGLPRLLLVLSPT